ncbi:MAG: N-acetyltransferase [Candidatus Moranbacteria bacterium]|nr:N-acetyltransferase [Candidatus Moranbacteria bacterium]
MFMENDIVIQQAQEEDGVKITELLYETWLSTYPNESLGITKEWIEEKFANRYSPEEQKRRSDQIKSQTETNKVFVAKEGKRVVGVCRFVQEEDRNQLRMIYVHPEYQGLGIGYRLWKVRKLVFDAHKKTLVCVASYNEKAITFYKKLGFRENDVKFVDDRLSHNGVSIPEIELEMSEEKEILSFS